MACHVLRTSSKISAYDKAETAAQPKVSPSRHEYANSARPALLVWRKSAADEHDGCHGAFYDDRSANEATRHGHFAASH